MKHWLQKKKKRKKKGSTYITFPWNYSNSGLELNMQIQFLTSFELGFSLLWIIKGSSTCLELLCFPATGRTGPPYHHIPYTPSVHYRYLTLQSNVHFHSYGTSFHKIKLILARNCTSNYSFAPQCGRGNHSFIYWSTFVLTFKLEKLCNRTQQPCGLSWQFLWDESLFIHLSTWTCVVSRIIN